MAQKINQHSLLLLAQTVDDQPKGAVEDEKETLSLSQCSIETLMQELKIWSPNKDDSLSIKETVTWNESSEQQTNPKKRKLIWRSQERQSRVCGLLEIKSKS